MPQRRDNARVQVLAHRNSCRRSVELSRLHYHTARLICNCIFYTCFHKVPDLLSGFRVNGIAVFATNFRISIALQIICVANCDAIPVKLLPGLFDVALFCFVRRASKVPRCCSCNQPKATPLVSESSIE